MGLRPEWSPDGEEIAFIRYRHQFDGGGTLFMVDVATGALFRASVRSPQFRADLVARRHGDCVHRACTWEAEDGRAIRHERQWKRAAHPHDVGREGLVPGLVIRQRALGAPSKLYAARDQRTRAPAAT